MHHNPASLASQTLPILVVEDLDEDFETVVDAANDVGVTNDVVRASSFAEAQVVISASASAFSFVLLDVNLPDGVGSDLVRALRGGDLLHSTPIVVFSTSDNARDLAELYAAGVNAYHVKVLRYQDNMTTLRAIFSYWLSAVRLPGSPTDR